MSDAVFLEGIKAVAADVIRFACNVTDPEMLFYKFNGYGGNVVYCRMVKSRLKKWSVNKRPLPSLAKLSVCLGNR